MYCRKPSSKALPETQKAPLRGGREPTYSEVLRLYAKQHIQSRNNIMYYVMGSLLQRGLPEKRLSPWQRQGAHDSTEVPSRTQWRGSCNQLQGEETSQKLSPELCRNPQRISEVSLLYMKPRNIIMYYWEAFFKRPFLRIRGELMGTSGSFL